MKKLIFAMIALVMATSQVAARVHPDIVKEKAPQLSYSERAHYAFHFFRELGWSKEHAAGLVGNLVAECGPGLVYETCTGDGGTAFGVAQWRFERVTKFHQVMGKPLRNASLAEQLYYVHWELTHPTSYYKTAAGDIIKRSKTASEAAALIDQLYERSAGHARRQRMAVAHSLYVEYKDWISNRYTEDPANP